MTARIVAVSVMRDAPAGGVRAARELRSRGRARWSWAEPPWAVAGEVVGTGDSGRDDEGERPDRRRHDLHGQRRRAGHGSARQSARNRSGLTRESRTASAYTVEIGRAH